ncbi:hypothetical protein [Chryseobacterium profundimaris]|uniref:Uncharacterized protein n=1 Tax=Chryseobacterium profundimaris TaxID=1387275 RepID=A0ABY1NIT0_9FLAO|nr:hypothetical protein [Chryseobacterium profundimaris]SMP10212.1 hypothetical protein SAMN06264346_102174 [Chryseobacterium profundimaris]
MVRFFRHCDEQSEEAISKIGNKVKNNKHQCSIAEYKLKVYENSSAFADKNIFDNFKKLCSSLR